MEKMPEQFNMLEIMAKVEERTPYVIVCFQVRAKSSSTELSVQCTVYTVPFTRCPKSKSTVYTIDGTRFTVH